VIVLRVPGGERAGRARCSSGVARQWRAGPIGQRGGPEQVSADSVGGYEGVTRSRPRLPTRAIRER
jgi:hypothetical protein